VRVLDLFCGAGGAAMGLHRAWPEAEIWGIDIAPQPRYPFKFVQGDWTEVGICKHWDFVWASPPCQRYSRFTPNKRKPLHPDLIPVVRQRLDQCGVAYVIENVPCAPLRRDITLVGAHFGSALIRERWFEANFLLLAPDKPKPNGKPLHFGGSSEHRKAASKQELAAAMGISWMTRAELGQAIPPAYSEYIARQWTQARTVAR
jgi:DNA (cytosine-5)-methyltransferase 1